MMNDSCTRSRHRVLFLLMTFLVFAFAYTEEARAENHEALLSDLEQRVGKFQLGSLDPRLSASKYLEMCNDLSSSEDTAIGIAASGWVEEDPDAEKEANAVLVKEKLRKRFDACQPIKDLHAFCENPLAKPFDEPPSLGEFAAIGELSKRLLPPRTKGQTFSDALGLFESAEVPPECKQDEEQARRAWRETVSDNDLFSGDTGAFGLNWQDAIVKGIASFLTARMKAELELMVQERIADELCEAEGAKDLLVDTCNVANNMKKLDAPLAWGTLRAAVEKDLRQLPPRLATKIFASSKPQVAAVLIATYRIIEGIHNGEDPVLALAAIEQILNAGVPGSKCMDDSAWCALRMVGVGTHVLGDGLENSISSESREIYMKLASRIFLHRVFKSKEAAIEAGRCVGGSKDTPEAANCDAYVDLVTSELWDVRTRLEILRSFVSDAQRKADDETRPVVTEDYFKIIGATVDVTASVSMIATGISADEAVCGVDSKESKHTQKCIAASLLATVHIAEAAEATAKQDYQAAVVSIFAFATRVGADIPDPLLKYGGFLADLVAAKTSEDVEKALKAVAAPVGSYKVKRGIPGFTFNRGIWEAQDISSSEKDECVGKAKTKKEEIENEEIENDNLEVRARCKKLKEKQGGERTVTWQVETRVGHAKPEPHSKPPFTMSINGFAGVQGGFDILLDSVTPTPRAWQAGFFLPVGLDFAWGLRKTGSVSLFASAFDLGAVGDFRLGDKNTNKESPTPQGATEMANDDTIKEVAVAPKVGLRQVISPGLYFTVGIPTFPVAVGAGASFAPELRSVSLDVDREPVTKRESALRLGLFVAVDIPMFVIYRSKRIKRAS